MSAKTAAQPGRAIYDDFAWFYNRYWNEEFHSLAFPILERIWLAHVLPGTRILDVCCGTGHLAGLLSARGHHVTGVDASPEMIRHACANTPSGEFHVADATRFQLPRIFGAAVSTFDSLNHVLSREALEAVFRQTAKALKPGALFAFDMLLDEAYQTHWGESFAIVRDDHLLTITGAGYDFRTRTARCTLTMFRFLEGAWRRSDVVIEERCYTPAEISAALHRAGFGELSCYAAGDIGMAGQLGEGRAFFVTRRL
ncbi:MAG TPA: class I SAM-dependent methyltransferase [Bryobacteraceae bacterium]|nr:class I SAM-dependent methyltransferase [Bryobacteraceae bacterium]